VLLAVLVPEILLLAATVLMGDADAPPLTTNLLVVDVRVVDELGQAHVLRAQAAHGLQHQIGRDDEIAPRRLELNLRGQIFLLGIEHVEDGALAHLLLFADARQSDTRGIDGSLIGFELSALR